MALKTGLNVPLSKNPTLDNFDKVREFLGSEKYTDQESYKESIYKDTKNTNRDTSIFDYGTPSLANRYSLFTWGGIWGDTKAQLADHYLDSSANNSVVNPDFAKNLSSTSIIDFFRTSENTGAMEYTYSDFLYCKYHKYIPNNYMLTLRRFAMPCEDNIYHHIKNTVKKGGGQEVINVTHPDLARAVTWIGEETGNTLENLLSFTYGFSYKEQVAETTTQVNSNEGYTGQPIYQQSGTILQSVLDVAQGVSPSRKYREQSGDGANFWDPLLETYPNFVLGPINVINKMQTRDQGLNFDQEIKLNFHYSQKSYNDINPKMALLDIMANLLVLTYNNANFWGGANRILSNGGFVTNRFGDDKKLWRGDFSGYMKSLIENAAGGFENLQTTADGGKTNFGGVAQASPNNIKSSASGGKGVIGTANAIIKGIGKAASDFLDESKNSSFGSTLFGNLTGGFINKFLGAPPAVVHAKGLLTGEATGNWHLTIGNPMNPIGMIGNLIMTDANLKFGGELSYDDFPSEMTLEVTLKHARPRDKTDFESIFNAGKGRLYAAADNLPDVLNLQGNDVKTYGSFQIDKNGKLTKPKVKPEDADEIIKRSKESLSSGYGKFKNLASNTVEDSKLLLTNLHNFVH